MDWHTAIGIFGAIAAASVGAAAAVGYWRSSSQKVWRETAEGWKTENEANKVRADRLAEELAHTATELKAANMRTDITAVLGVLQTQHKEATAVLTRIADEGAARDEAHVAMLKRIADESAERNGHIAEALSRHTADEAVIWRDITKLVTETFNTVEALKATEVIKAGALQAVEARRTRRPRGK